MTPEEKAVQWVASKLAQGDWLCESERTLAANGLLEAYLAGYCRAW